MFSFLKKQSKTDTPEWVSRYLSLDFKSNQKKCTDEVTYVILDCETTGLSSTDEIVTIGAVKCTAKEIFLDQLLDQHYPKEFTGKSSEIHGELGRKEICEMENLQEELIEFLGNHIIVGHNISFDIGMINAALKQSFGFRLKNLVLDTFNLAKRVDPIKYERNIGGKNLLQLDTLCQENSIEIENRHTALGDAYMTAQLLQRLLTQLKKRGLTKINELRN